MDDNSEYRLNYLFPWDEGKHRMYGWQLLITWLTFGAAVNAVQLYFHGTIKQLRKQPICRIIIWLSSIDFTFDVICLIQCSLNYHFKQFFGEQLFCTAQAFWAELLMAMSGFSIGCTLLASYMAIIHNRVLTTKEIDKLHLGALLYCLILSILGSIAPGQGTLNSSGLFCYTASHHVAEGVIFHIGYILPLISTLVYLWYRMYQRVQDMTKFLAKRKLNIEARKGQVRMAKRMAWYIYILLLCFLPYEFAVWYAWITGRHPPFQMWITFGMFGHILTVASPILYYVLNQSARHIVYKHLSQFCCPRAGKQDTSQGSQSGDSKNKGKRLIDAAQLEELVNALSNPSLLNQMLAYADDRYCSEGILFWIDVQVWKTMCSKVYNSPQLSERVLSSSQHGLMASLRGLSSSTHGVSSSTMMTASPSFMNSSSSFPSAPATPERPERTVEMTDLTLPTTSEIKESKKEDEHGDIDELREFAKSVYLTYFIRGGDMSAPLELNIGDEIIQKVLKDLKITEAKDGPVCMFEWTPELKNLFDAAEQEVLRLLHDNVYRPFCTKIQMTEILDNQNRLKNLHSGDILPFDDDETREGSRSGSRSHFDSTQVVLPKGGGGGGGVSTRKKNYYGSKRSSICDREESISAQVNETSISTRSGVQPDVYHVGIDTHSTFRLLFRENLTKAAQLSPTTMSPNNSQPPSPVFGATLSPVSTSRRINSPDDASGNHGNSIGVTSSEIPPLESTIITINSSSTISSIPSISEERVSSSLKAASGSHHATIPSILNRESLSTQHNTLTIDPSNLKRESSSIAEN